MSFVSEAWGRCVSDKVVTKESSILNKLLPGDLVLADGGFNIGDLIAEYHTEAVLPAFTRGKSQLSVKEVLECKELARVHIHIGRLIRRYGEAEMYHSRWCSANKFHQTCRTRQKYSRQINGNLLCTCQPV